MVAKASAAGIDKVSRLLLSQRRELGHGLEEAAPRGSAGLMKARDG